MSKDTTIRFRVATELAETFEKICLAESKKSSVIMRELIENYILTHELISSNLDVDISIGEPYGRGAMNKEEYDVSAKVIGDVGILNSQEITFLLPEFTIDGFEPYRIDSFYYHREFFPNCRNQSGRLLGSKLIKNKWNGAIFLYKDAIIKNPETAFSVIKEKLRESILIGVKLVLEKKKLTLSQLPLESVEHDN